MIDNYFQILSEKTMKQFETVYENMNGGISEQSMKQWIKTEKKKEKAKASSIFMNFSDKARFSILICDNLF